jgi:carbon-monoxide dehydrogenase medium subunit
MAGAGGNARALAGGSDLVDQMRVGRRTPNLVVDIKNIPDMQRLEYIPGEGLYIGAGVSCTRTGEYAPVAEHYPSIKEVCGLIGSTQIQNRASIAGNVCNSAPSGDTIPPLLTYDAKCIVVGPGGRREVPIGEFFAGPGQNVMAADELLLEILVPPPPANSSGRYLRFIPREEMDIAVAGVGSMVAVDPKTGKCLQARIALASVAPTPVRATDAESALEGQVLTKELVRQAAELAPNAARPINDVRGTIEYRMELCNVLTRRTLEHCLADLGM